MKIKIAQVKWRLDDLGLKKPCPVAIERPKKRRLWLLRWAEGRGFHRSWWALLDGVEVGNHLVAFEKRRVTRRWLITAVSDDEFQLKPVKVESSQPPAEAC